ncbi:hypothetical protein [Clostridium sp. SM-530-WT-3G]|nr:hypothetical protein [Clostridium sp. SM-530-WT-3G]NME83414.1 hypothetical protein [Clostridium sp. SM-530-WT-3G]
MYEYAALLCFFTEYRVQFGAIDFTMLAVTIPCLYTSEVLDVGWKAI